MHTIRVADVCCGPADEGATCAHCLSHHFGVCLLCDDGTVLKDTVQALKLDQLTFFFGSN